MKEFDGLNMKLFPNSTGVYLITFNGSNRVYIGSALRVNLKHPRMGGFNSRWRAHLLDFKKQKNGIKLQRAYNKYGKKNLIFKILEETSTIEGVEREQFYIDKYNSYKNGYNSRPLANSNVGAKRSLAIRKKQSEFQLKKLKKERDLVLFYYPKYKNSPDVAKVLNISVSTVHRVLRESGAALTKKVPHKGRSVCQYDEAGNKIKEWSSVRAASRDLNVSQQAISNILNGKLSKVCNLIFKIH